MQNQTIQAKSNNLAIVSAVLGVLALIYPFILGAGLIAALAGIVAATLGFVTLNRAATKGLAWAGIALGILAAVLVLLGMLGILTVGPHA